MSQTDDPNHVRRLILSAHQAAVDSFRRWAETFGDEHAKAAIFAAAEVIEIRDGADEVDLSGLGKASDA